AGTEQERPGVLDPQAQAREEPGVLVVQAELPRSDRFDVTEAIEDRKRVPVLQDTCAVVDPGRGRKDVGVFSDPYDLFLDPGHVTTVGRGLDEDSISRS